MYVYVHVYGTLLSMHAAAIYTEQIELCLDCRCQAAELLLQQCQLKGHKGSIVVYSDAECRELVPVHWPVNASKLPLNERSTVTEEHLNICDDRTECSSPHHYLEAKILNQWRENTVVINTRPSPVRIPNSLYPIYRMLITSSVPSLMQTWFLAELKRAATMYKRVSVS